MKNYFLIFLTCFFISITIGCSSVQYKQNSSNLSCLKEDDKGFFSRSEYGYTYALVDSSYLYVYSINESHSNFPVGSSLYYATKHNVKAGYFSQTRCGKIYHLDYENLKKIYKSTLPEFVKKIKSMSDDELILPLDSINKVPRINVLLKKYKI
jgi:hypothetical protein